MSDWKRFTRRDRCPVCDGIRYDCRQNLSSRLIHCRHAGADPLDYVYRGEDKFGFGLWAYKPDADNWNDERHKEWSEQNRQRKESEKKSCLRSLSDRERDREIRKIFDQLLLSDRDRELIKNRKYVPDSFTDNCVSVKKWQRLRESVNPGLPGVNYRGDTLNNPVDGILIPVINELSLWVAMRLYNPQHEENDTGKYTWLSSSTRLKSGTRNQNSENPIAVYLPSEIKREGIGFVEGIEFKPAIAAERLGMPIIGAAGGNFAGSPKAVVAAVEFIEKKYGSGDFTLFGDSGWRTNKNINNEYRKLDELLGLTAVADWGQAEDTSVGDIDEIADLDKISYRSPDDFFPDEQKNLLQEQFKKIIRLFGGKGKKSPAKPKAKFITYAQEAGLPDYQKWVGMGEPKIYYEIEDRLNLWLELRKKGYPHVLDSSFMGSGKSYSVALYAESVDKEIDLAIKEALKGNPPEGGIRNSIIGYVSSNYANPPIPALAEQFLPLLPRGEQTGCDRAYLFNQISELGYDPNLKSQIKQDDTGTKKTNIICATCPKFSFCGHQAGMYRFERSTTLQSASKFRSHPFSLPRELDNYPYGNVDLFIEETGRELKPTKSITTNYQDLILEINHCTNKFDDRFDLLAPIIYLVNFHHIKLLGDIFKILPRYPIDNIISSYLEGLNTVAQWHEALSEIKLEDFVHLSKALNIIYQTKKKHGLNRNQIRGLLPKLKTLNLLIDFVEFSSFNLAEIFKSPDKILLGKQKIQNIGDQEAFKKQVKALNQNFSKENKQELEENLQELPAKALVHILKVLRGDKNVTARASNKRIYITVEDRWYKKIFEETKINFFLDATLSLERLKLITGINTPIVEVRAIIKEPLKNLTIYNIQVAGTKTAGMSNRAIGATEKVIKKINQIESAQVKLLTHKKLSEKFNANGWWFNDNRGTNKFEGQGALIALGTPYPNIGLIKDEYFVLKGNLVGFEDYYDELVRGEQLQLVGRQRCQRYPDQQFKLYLLGAYQNFSWLSEYGCQVIDQHGSEYASEAGGKVHHLKHQIWIVAHQIAQETGGKITQEEIAARVGRKQGRISQLFKESGLTVKRFWEVIKKNINSASKDLSSEINIFRSDPDYRSWMGLGAIDCLEQTIEAIVDMGWANFKEYLLDCLPDPVRIRIIGILTPFFIEVPHQQTE